VNFAMPDNDQVQVLDAKDLIVSKTLKPGHAVLHMEFTPRGETVWLALRDDDRVAVYDTETLTEIAHLPADKPSGIFFTARANELGL